MKLDNNFIGKCFTSSIKIPSDSDYNEVGIYSKNTIFFYNTMIELLSYESNYGTRIKNNSLITVINNEIEYFNDITKMNLIGDKPKTIPIDRKNYAINKIITNQIISKDEIRKYSLLLDNELRKSNDIDYISVLKMINSSLKRDNKYFNEVSDYLYNLILDDTNFLNYEEIYLYSKEYISLLIEFGLSIKSIRDVFKDYLRLSIQNKNQGYLMKFFEKFGELVNEEKKFIIIVKMKKDYNDLLIKSLKLGRNKQFQVMSKKGVQSLYSKVSNQKQLSDLLKKLDNDNTNPSFLKAEIRAHDKWQAINKFKYKCLQPYLGSLRYSGIHDDMADEKFTVITVEDEKHFINEYKNNEDVFSPINQSRISYTDLYKRYIIKSQQNEIKLLIDEVISFLPSYYKSSNSLSRFSNVWFAFESLYKNASEKIIESLQKNACPIITDKCIAGYLNVSYLQYIYLVKNKPEQVSNRIESTFREMFSNDSIDSEFFSWKVKKIQAILENYSMTFNKIEEDVKYHISTMYHLRNKQFHGTKEINLDYATGYIYDIVNENLEFLMDYMDVYKDQDCNLSDMYSSMSMIKKIKEILMKDQDQIYKKVGILVDSIRKI